MWAYSNQPSEHLSRGAACLSRPSVGGWLWRLNPWHWLMTWLRHETSVTELYALDDQTLADLGITRGDFPAILSGTYRRGE